MFVYERRRNLTTDERDDTVVPYLPWFGTRAVPAEPRPDGVPDPTAILARPWTGRTLPRSVLRGAALGAGVTMPWWSASFAVPLVGAAIGTIISAATHRRTSRRRTPSDVTE